MSKSSRFWWLHGAILLSAVIGCKNCNSGGGCGPSMGGGGGAPPYSGTVSTTGPIGSGGPTMYSSSTPGASMPGGSSFPAGASAGYPMPNMASQMGQGMGGIR